MIYWCNSVLLMLVFLARADAQDTTKYWQFTAYAEAYYSYDLNRPGDNLRPPFFYSFNKHSQPRFNIAMAEGSYASDRFRANLGIMAGTYSQYNLAQEPELLRHIYEANIGVRLASGLWLDAGVLPSHIGLESAIGKNCFSLTRSIMADNSPYYESGMRVGYERGKWYMAMFLLNGWQRIRPVEGNSLPSFGHQLQFRPDGRWTLNSSSFIGTDKPDAERKMRYFHNLYAQFLASEKVDLQFAWDIGAEQKAKGSDAYNSWTALVAGLRYKFRSMMSFGAVMEYYADKGSVLTSTDTGLPLRTLGASGTVDLHINKLLQWRTEWRWLNGREKIFLREGLGVRNSNTLTTSLAVSL